MSGHLDPVTLEILWTRLISAVDEASAAFVRTSFSTLVREANDYAVVLTDAEGRSLAQSSMSIPSFIGTLPATVKHFLKRFPPEQLAQGDVLITNDPWMTAGQLNDFTGVTNGRYKLIRYTHLAHEELYDLKRDPYELDNLLAHDQASYRAMSRAGREAVDTLRAALDRLVDCSGASCR